MEIPYVRDKSAAVRSNVIDVETQTVDYRGTTRHKTGVVQCHWVLDFSNVTPENMLELAKRSVVISMQRRFRDSEKSELGVLATRNHVDVADEMRRELAGPMSPEAVVKRAAGMTAEQRAALIAELEKLDAAQ